MSDCHWKYPLRPLGCPGSAHLVHKLVDPRPLAPAFATGFCLRKQLRHLCAFNNTFYIFKYSVTRCPSSVISCCPTESFKEHIIEVTKRTEVSQ